MPVLDHQFTLNSGNALPYDWTASNGVAITTNRYQHNNKKYEVGLASLFIYMTPGEAAPTSIAITHKYWMDRDGNWVSESNNVLSNVTDNTSYSVALSGATVFEARLDMQSWWKFSAHGGIFLLTPTGSGDLTINEMRVVGV